MAVAMRWACLSRCGNAAAAPAAQQLASSSAKLHLSRTCSLLKLRPNWADSVAIFEKSGGLFRLYSVGNSRGDCRPGSFVLTRASVKADVAAAGGEAGKNVRVRFAPSPTGNLHVGGARTALFNFLFARATGGKFILRIEDTDLERSTRESEEAMLRDLEWLGLDYDEGPNKAGEYGPYRQSERNNIYKEYVGKLLKTGEVYRCFCSDEELEEQRTEAKAKNLPPKYMGKWGTASDSEIEAELAKGTPYTYRFRVPQEGSITINDLVRGEVTWSKETLGDFIVLRSNGQPVYNFCVAVDDATMKITHVIRAEEHLPNTLRQALIYKALGFPMPQFGHVSLILAPDRSKLSKRHGATSVGQFREMGFLPQAMVNYLALLGWNDGSEEEIFTIESIIQKFSIDRITKSAAIFDNTKLGWMNGQHLRALPAEGVSKMLGEQWVKSGIVSKAECPFVTRATELIQNGIDIISEGDVALLNILAYPLHSTLQTESARVFLGDYLNEVAEAVIEGYDSGALQAAIDGGHDTWKKWVNSIGKAQKRKGKRLFMPVRILLTGRMQGPDIGSILALLKEGEVSGSVSAFGGLIPLAQRIKILKEVDWSTVPHEVSATADAVPVLTL